MNRRKGGEAGARPRGAKNIRLVYTAARYHTNQHFIVKALLEEGYDVSFIVLRRGQSETYETLQPEIIGCSPTFEMLRRWIQRCFGISPGATGGLPPPVEFWFKIRGLHPTAVVVRDPFFAYGLLAVLVTKLIGARLILYTQTPVHRPLGRCKRFLILLVSRVLGAAWITPVLGTPNRYKPSRTLCYLPFVIPPQTAPGDKRWFIGGTVNILAIGKYEPRKNHHLFLKMIHRLSRHYPIRATIIGECTTSEHLCELESVRRHCERLELDGKVEFKVNLPFPEVQRHYATHDVFVLASRNEWAAVSPLEAMAHSLPVVCSDSNGTKCYLHHGENGFVFCTDDLGSLEACMLEIVSDRERLVEMGRRSYQLVVSNHAPKRYVQALITIIAPSVDLPKE